MSNFKILSYHPNALVIQDNTFIEFPRHLNLQEQKIFLFIISSLNPQDSIDSNKDCILRVFVKDFAKSIKLKTLSDGYRDMRKCIKKLQEKVLTISTIRNNKQLYIDISILSYACYVVKEGYVDLKLNPDILPFLFELKSHFTKYKFKYIAQLSSTYAVRIYELLKKVGSKSYTFELSSLRRLLDVSENKLVEFRDFKKIVLEISKREINNKTDLFIDYDCLRTGKRITHIRFSIKTKKSAPSENNSEDLHQHNSTKQFNSPNTDRDLLSYGISAEEIMSLADNYSIYEIKMALQVMKEQCKKGNAKNPKALFKKALKSKWIPNKQEQDFNYESTTRANKMLSLGECIENLLPKNNYDENIPF